MQIERLSNILRLLGLWILLFCPYLCFLLLTSTLLRALHFNGVPLACGIWIGIFPLISGLWPTYWWRWDLALFWMAVQCSSLVFIVWLTISSQKIIRKLRSGRGKS